MVSNDKLAEQLALLLTKSHLKLAIAESCTGGGLAYQLTEIPGSSLWFERGFITYSNLSKQEMLGVSPQTLESHGAVSAETAKEMAEGILKQSIADISLSITGIAGPTGGTIDKPIGTVWFGLARRGSGAEVRLVQFVPTNRKQIRYDAIGFALNWLIEKVSHTS